MNPAKAKIAHREEARIAAELKAEDEVLPAPPDGGYGWVVVAASFFCNLVVDGISYCFGIFLVELVKHYGVPKGKAAWVGSILTGATMCAGPFVSALANKFGCRAACIAGSVVATAGFALSIYCTSIEQLMIVYGLIGGIGFGFIYLPAVVCVGYYFETKRSLATGIAVCGSGVGTFAVAPLANILITNYGWQKANLVLALIIACCAICGLLMKPLEYKSKEENEEEPNHNLSNGHSNGNIHRTNTSEGEMGTSRLSIASKKSHVVQPLSRKDVFYSGSVLNLKEFQSQKSLNDYRHSVHSIPQIKSKKTEEICTCLPEGVRKLLTPVLDLMVLFKDPVFMCIAVSNLFGIAALYIPFVYIVECAISDGVEAGAASFLLSIIGIVNTISRLICGYCADFPQVNTLLVNNICLVVAAASVAMMPFSHTYTAYVAVLIVFSFTTAGWISLTSIILVDLLGLDKLTNAFGLVILFRGVAAFVGSPLAGVLYDMTKSYDLPFFMSSGLFAASAASSLLVPVVQSIIAKKKRPVVDDEALTPMNRLNEQP